MTETHIKYRSSADTDATRVDETNI